MRNSELDEKTAVSKQQYCTKSMQKKRDRGGQGEGMEGRHHGAGAERGWGRGEARAVGTKGKVKAGRGNGEG